MQTIMEASASTRKYHIICERRLRRLISPSVFGSRRIFPKLNQTWERHVLFGVSIHKGVGWRFNDTLNVVILTLLTHLVGGMLVGM